MPKPTENDLHKLRMHAKKQRIIAYVQQHPLNSPDTPPANPDDVKALRRAQTCWDIVAGCLIVSIALLIIGIIAWYALTLM